MKNFTPQRINSLRKLRTYDALNNWVMLYMQKKKIYQIAHFFLRTKRFLRQLTPSKTYIN